MNIERCGIEIESFLCFNKVDMRAFRPSYSALGGVNYQQLFMSVFFLNWTGFKINLLLSKESSAVPDATTWELFFINCLSILLNFKTSCTTIHPQASSSIGPNWFITPHRQQTKKFKSLSPTATNYFSHWVEILPLLSSSRSQLHLQLLDSYKRNT